MNAPATTQRYHGVPNRRVHKSLVETRSQETKQPSQKHIAQKRLAALKRSEEALAKLAFFEKLTGLPLYLQSCYTLRNKVDLFMLQAIALQHQLDGFLSDM